MAQIESARRFVIRSRLRLICLQFGKYLVDGEQIPVFCRLENVKWRTKTDTGRKNLKYHD